MARTAFWGFESNDSSTSGTGIEKRQGTGCSFDTSTVRTGTYSGKVALTSGSTGFFTFPTPTSGYCRFYVLVTSRPATTARILFGSAAAAGFINLRLNPAGTIGFYTQNTLIGTSTTALTDTSRWYMIELRRADGTSVTVLQIDGVAEVTGSPSSWTLAASCGSTDTVADTYTAYFDDLTLDGAAFPGPGKVVLLKPTADSAVGTGWTLGTGTAISSNGFGSVDNTPPVGVTNLEAGSDPKQIRNAASAANSNYDATMTTYTAVGIGASDTINSIDPFVLTAAPVVTSAKQGTVGVASNPAITNIALSVDGAFWEGNAEGTYSTGWKLSHGTLTSSPSVTLGTAPVMRITQVTSSTRIATVCFMGIYVDYTEHRSPPFSRRHRNYIIR